MFFVPFLLNIDIRDCWCFADIQVAKTATIAELKEAVEAAFSHMPQKGPGKISWCVSVVLLLLPFMVT